jgi:hypothetical protein
LISARICTRRFASRLDKGSSNRNTAGSRTIALPMATRCPVWTDDDSVSFRASMEPVFDSGAARAKLDQSALIQPLFDGDPLLLIGRHSVVLTARLCKGRCAGSCGGGVRF